MKRRQAKKIRRNFYRAFRALEAWQAYRWQRDEAPALREAMSRVFKGPRVLDSEPAEPEVPPILRKVAKAGKWPQMPSDELLVRALRCLRHDEGYLEWYVDLRLWNVMVRKEIAHQEGQPHTWMTTGDMARTTTSVVALLTRKHLYAVEEE